MITAVSGGIVYLGNGLRFKGSVAAGLLLVLELALLSEAFGSLFSVVLCCCWVLCYVLYAFLSSSLLFCLVPPSWLFSEFWLVSPDVSPVGCCFGSVPFSGSFSFSLHASSAGGWLFVLSSSHDANKECKICSPRFTTRKGRVKKKPDKQVWFNLGVRRMRRRN